MNDLLNKETWFMDWADLNYGVWCYTCRSKAHNVPLGFLYGFPLGKVFFIAGIYTPSWARRKGVATFLLEKLSKDFKTLITQEGSLDGGKQLLQAFGFKETENIEWIYQNEKIDHE